MTPREAFKMGFARRCAEEGLTPEQAAARVEKAAAYLEKNANLLGDLAAKHPMELAVGAPMAAGALGGWAAHQLTSHDVDEEDVRKRELIDELRHWARRAREQPKAKQ